MTPCGRQASKLQPSITWYNAPELRLRSGLPWDSMSSPIYVAIDDATPELLTLGGVGGVTWTIAGDDVIQNHWFGGSTLFPSGTGGNASASGSMAFSFQGMAFALFGNTGGNQDQSFKVSIDDSTPYSTSTGDNNPQTYLQWYQSPALDDRAHKVNISGILGTAIDLILVTPGPNTDLIEKTLMVDDTYPSFKYFGNGWKQVSNAVLQEATGIRARAFKNSTHQSISVGDSFTFSYTGTNATIYGIQPQSAGSSAVSFTYMIDKGSPSTVTLTPPRTDGTDLLNLPLLSTGSLVAGDHTIVVNITNAQSQPLIIDYALFTPSFSSLATIPDDSPMASGSVSGSNTSSSLPSPTGQPTESSSHGSSPPAGAIAGGIVGGLAVIALFILGIYILRHRSSRKAELDAEPPKDVGLASAPVSEYRPSNNIRTPRYVSPPPLTSDHGSTISESTNLSRDQTIVDIQRRLAALQQIVANADNPSTSGSSQSQDIAELRYQIDLLKRENERLTAMSQPPAYGTNLSH